MYRDTNFSNHQTYSSKDWRKTEIFIDYIHHSIKNPHTRLLYIEYPQSTNLYIRKHNANTTGSLFSMTTTFVSW